MQAQLTGDLNIFTSSDIMDTSQKALNGGVVRL